MTMLSDRAFVSELDEPSQLAQLMAQRPKLSRRGHLAVLDDEGDFCDFVEYVGDICGFNVFGTTRPRVLLDHLDHSAAAIIILDLNMPEADGLEVLRHLGRVGIKANIIIATGAGEDEIEAAKKVGAAHGLRMSGVIYKPINAVALTALLEKQICADDPLSAERLAAAVEAEELALHYQPMLDLQTGKIVGVEALIRWPHPELGLVMPLAFIPMAEQSGMIGEITLWALTEAARQAGEWAGKGIDLKISVNVSIAGMMDDSLPDQLEQICLRSGVKPAMIVLELTESAAMRDPGRAENMFARFRAKGFELALDDFGTGYSSLAHLQRLPFSSLKIDRIFVASMLAKPDDAALVVAVISLAHALGLTCVAEGVETQEMVDFLKANGCDLAQGYHIAKPMPAAEIAAFCRA